MADAAEFPVFEVFIQKDALSNATHVGSLRAANPALALQLARETFGRRETAHDLWVVPQGCIYRASEDPVYVPHNSSEDKRYRLPSGYDNAQRWKRFKARAITIEDIQRDLKTSTKDGRRSSDVNASGAGTGSVDSTAGR